MIANGRRIDQRTTMSQQGGVDVVRAPPAANGFDPIVFDGRDPAAFAWAILEIERRLEGGRARVACGRRALSRSAPVRHRRGAEGRRLLRRGHQPRPQPAARRRILTRTRRRARRFNASARRCGCRSTSSRGGRARSSTTTPSGRPRERDHRAGRPARPRSTACPSRRSGRCRADRARPRAVDDQRRRWPPSTTASSATVRANPHLRPRVGNPDEMR